MDLDDLDTGPGLSNSLRPNRDTTPDRSIEPTTSGRPRKFPRHFKDFFPSLSVRLPHMPPPPSPSPPIEDPQLEHLTSPSPPLADPESPTLSLPDVYETEPDEFGLFRSYASRPTYIPDEDLPLDAVCDAAGLAIAKSDTRGCQSGFASSATLAGSFGDIFAPFLNATVFRLMSWFYSGSNTKSVEELDKLVNEVILAEDFNSSDLKGFRAARELERLNNHSEEPNFDLPSKDGWIETSVNILLPAERNRNQSESDAPQFTVEGLFYRPLTEVIKSAFQGASAEGFHLTPFRLFWQHSENEPPERIISEMYNSDAVLEEHEKIQSQPHESGCTLETVVASVMLWSDSTHLAQFGTASLWPIYMFFGNQSKYTRAKPTSFSANHIAYIPSVSCLRLDYCILDKICICCSYPTLFKTYIDQYLTSVPQQLPLLTSNANSCKPFGPYFSTQTSCTDMSMELLFSLRMGFNDASSRGFLPIQQTIPKSMSRQNI